MVVGLYLALYCDSFHRSATMG